MNPTKINQKVKEKLLRAKKHKVYADLVQELDRLGANTEKKRIRTRELEKVHKNPGRYLKNLEKVKVVCSVKKGSAPFLLDHAGITKKERFLHIAPDISAAREKRTANLLDQVQVNPDFLILCAKILNLKNTDDIPEILEKIRYSDDKDQEKVNLESYNQVVKELKKNKIKLVGFDEFEWSRGSFSWYIHKDFVIECTDGGEKNG